MPSVIHEIPGLPLGGGDHMPNGAITRRYRVYLITAWTKDDIEDARRCVREGNVLQIQHHFGTSGVDGDEWWSFVVQMPVDVAEKLRGDAMPTRYGLDRWKWPTSQADIRQETD